MEYLQLVLQPLKESRCSFLVHGMMGEELISFPSEVTTTMKLILKA